MEGATSALPPTEYASDQCSEALLGFKVGWAPEGSRKNPLRGGWVGKAGPLRKKNFFSKLEKKFRKMAIKLERGAE